MMDNRVMMILTFRSGDNKENQQAIGWFDGIENGRIYILPRGSRNGSVDAYSVESIVELSELIISKYDHKD